MSGATAVAAPVTASPQHLYIGVIGKSGQLYGNTTPSREFVNILQAEAKAIDEKHSPAVESLFGVKTWSYFQRRPDSAVSVRVYNKSVQTADDLLDSILRL